MNTTFNCFDTLTAVDNKIRETFHLFAFVYSKTFNQPRQQAVVVSCGIIRCKTVRSFNGWRGCTAVQEAARLLCERVVQQHVVSTHAAVTTRNTANKCEVEWRLPGNYSTEWRTEFPGTWVLNGGYGRSAAGRRQRRIPQRTGWVQDHRAEILRTNKHCKRKTCQSTIFIVRPWLHVK